MWTIAIYELKRMIRAKTVLGLLIVAPLVLIFILGLALQDIFQLKDEQIEPLSIAIYDADQSQISSYLYTFMAGDDGPALFIPQAVSSREELIDRIRTEDVHMGLYIPKGFNQLVMSGQEASWEIITGKDREKNLRGQMILDSFLDEINRIQATIIALGPEALQTIGSEASMGLSSATINTQGIGTLEQHKEQSQYSFVSYVQPGQLTGSKEYSAAQYYASTMTIMFLLYAGLMAAISILQEKEAHTLSRLQSMPFSPISILLGKMIGNGLLACLQATVLILVTMFVFDVDWGHSFPYLILICLLAIFTSMSLALIVAFLFNSTKLLGGAFGTFIGIMTFLSGGMSPNDGTFLEKIKPFTVNYWAADSIHHLMLGSSSSIIHQHLIVLFGLGCLFLLISLGLYRKVGYHE